MPEIQPGLQNPLIRRAVEVDARVRDPLARDLKAAWDTARSYEEAQASMATKKTLEIPTRSIVNFSFGDRTYQIDPGKKKVYRRFVEIETAKAFEILSTWRSQSAGV